jgi:hypothetical protein
MFIYVHTLKEPSSIHHENVKAINTILEYQQKYDGLNEERKCGYGKINAIKEMLLDHKVNIGHNADILATSVYRTMESVQGVDWNTRLRQHFSEPISNITSTKAAIPEYERELIDESELKKNTTKKSIGKGKLEKSLFIQEYARYKGSQAKERPLKMLRTKISKESSLPNKNRSKVHDCILDVIEQNNHITTVFDMAEWNILKNSSKTLADICIKAQYGAKREFYVINVGSKACARVLENMFEEICKQLPNEMISVPGDKKLLKMQDFLNQALSRKGSTDRIYFVNGDCTKWSAAETMECFLSSLVGLAGHIDEQFIKYMSSVILMWGNKDITIPISLLQNTFFTTEGHTKYLETHKATLNSDQNFLQGMFNYMSSFKAVCSSNLTRDVWRQIRPNSKLTMEHMEHSDDYSLIITTKDILELEELRILHRVLMRCHGFNDSVKKTNTQQFLMEFISLVSLNGHMTYPHIKKLKECGMNLGCTGYRDDVDGAMSRVGEAVRVGSILTSAYFMQRCHLANICRSYSTLENQRNNFSNLKSLCNLPVELFGVPDTHPITSLLCKGLVNNYRLLKFAGDTEHKLSIDNEVFMISNKKIMRNLLDLETQETNDRDEVTNVEFTEGDRLFHPRYTFDQENKLIKKIRSKVKMSFEENIEFWNNHKTYNFLKPKNRDLLIDWMRAMYYRHSFALAYSRNSRAQITLRLSTYTSKECCIVGKTDDQRDIYDSIKGYVKSFLKNTLPKKHHGFDKVSEMDMKELEKASMNSDSTVSSLYSFFRESRILPHGKHTRMTISTLTPSRISWLNMDNPAGSLCQYMFNFEDFKKDMRTHKGLASLSADRGVIESFYGQNLDESTSLSTIKSVFTDVIMSKDQRNLCMSYSNSSKTLEEFLSNHIEFGSIYKTRFQVVTSGVKEAINPHTGEKYFSKMRTTTKNPNRALIDDAALLYSVLRHSSCMDINLIKKILKTMEIKDPNDDLSEPYTFSSLLGLTLVDLKPMGFSVSELKTFAFMKAFMTNDSADLTRLASDNLVFSYQYEKLTGTELELFSEAVKFEYQNSQFRALKIKNTNQIVVEVDAPKKHLLTDAYLIAQKLFGIITQSVLEKTISTITLKGLMTSKNLMTMKDVMRSEGFHEYKLKSNASLSLIRDDKTGYFSFKTISSDASYDSIFFYVEDIESPTVAQTEPINKRITIEWDQNSVFVGNKKLFTLPVLGCHQSNMSYLRDDYESNGLSLNWWLQESRLRRFVHEDEISTTRDIFEKIGGYKLGDENFMLALSSVRNFERLINIPSIKLFMDNSKASDVLKERIKKKRQNLQDVERIIEEENRVKEENERKEQNAPPLSSRINWSDAFSSMGVITDSIAAVIGTQNPTSPTPNVEIKPGKYFDEECGLWFDLQEDDIEDDYPDEDDSMFPIDKHYTINDDGQYDDINYTENELGEMDPKELAKLIEREVEGFGTFKVIEEEEESSDEDFEREIIKDDSGSSESSKSDDRYLAFNEFQNMVPKIETKDVIFTSGKSHSTQKLRRLGEPTLYIIRSNFVDQGVLSVVKTKDKLTLMYRLKAMIELCEFMSDHELMMTLTLLSEILKSFKNRDEWSITEDFVLTIEENDDFQIFMKYTSFLPKEAVDKIVRNKGRVVHRDSKMYFLIPLTGSKKKEYLDSLAEDIDVLRFVNIKPLEECYTRMYKEPFRRIGFASKLLSEFL